MTPDSTKSFSGHTAQLGQVGNHSRAFDEDHIWMVLRDIREPRSLLGAANPLLLGWERLLLCSKIGFRHLCFQHRPTEATITCTENHRLGLVDGVFGSQEGKGIADLLLAWTMRDEYGEPAMELLGLCAGYLVGLQHLVPLSPRLLRLVISSVELTKYVVLKEVGMERFIEFLNHLHVTSEEIDDGPC